MGTLLGRFWIDFWDCLFKDRFSLFDVLLMVVFMHVVGWIGA